MVAGSLVGKDKYTPIFILEDCRSRVAFGDAVPEKGADPYASKVSTDCAVWLRHPQIKLGSPGERAIRLRLEKVAEELKRKVVTVVLDNAPKGESQASALQESTVTHFTSVVELYDFGRTPGIEHKRFQESIRWWSSKQAS